MPVAWDEFESVGTNWDDFEPASPRYADEIISDLPERERRRLDLLSERAAVEADPEVRMAKEQEDLFKFAETPLIYPEDILAPEEARQGVSPTTRGVSRGIAETVSGLTSPQNLALLALGPAGKIAGKAAAGLFGYEMARTQPELAAEAGRASVEGTEEERALANTRLGINTVLGGLTLAAPFGGVRTRNQIIRETLARELENAPLEVPSPDVVARNLAEPGTFRPQEQYGVPRVEPPVEMFEAGEVPFERMPRFGGIGPPAILSREPAIEGGPRLPQGGQQFTGLEGTPDFAKSAEQRIMQRAEPPREVVRPEVERAAQPVRDVEQIVADKLRQRDLVAAADTLAQQPAEISNKIVDKLLGVGRESVGMDAASKTVFRELWEKVWHQGTSREAPIPLENFKIDTSKATLQAFGLAPAVWNRFISDIQAQVAQGRAQLEAVRNAVTKIKEAFPDFDAIGAMQALTRGLPEQSREQAALSGAITKAEQVGLTKSAQAAKGVQDASRVTEAAEVYGDVRQQPGEGQRQVPAEGSGARVQPDAAPVESARAETGAQPEVPLRPRLVAAIKTASGRTYTGERHPFALANAMDQIRETGGTKAGEMAAELADAQQGFVDVQSGEFMTRSEAAKKMGATGELTSEMIPEPELKANVAELQKRQPLQELRDLPADAGTAKAMELGAKVPKELIPELEALAKTAADEANRVIEEVDAIPNPTNADLARMSESSTRSQLLNEAVEGAKGGEPAIMARGKTPPTEPPPTEGIISGSAAEKWADQGLGKDPRTKARASLDPIEEGRRIAAVAIKGAAVIERGVRDFAAWSTEMVKTYGPEIQKDLQRIFGMSNAYVEQSRSMREGGPLVPETAGESVKMRKSAERATTAPNVPKPVQERISEAPESLYKQQSMERVEEAVGTMTEGELAAVPRDSDLYTAARLEQANRLFKQGKNDAGYNVFVELEKEGTRLGQLINQFKLLKGSRPENVVAIINSKLRSAGKDVLTKEQSTQAVKLASDSKAADAALDKATVEWQKSPTGENAKKAEAVLDAANASAVELQKFVGKFDPRSLSAILKSVLQGNLLTPISQGANLIGNINFQPARATTRGIATGLDIIDAAIRKRPREVAVQPLSGTAEALKGVGKGLKKVPDVLARGTGETIKGETRAGLHPLRAWVNQFAKNPSMPTTKGRLTLKDRLGLAIEGTMGVPAEGMLRLLGAVDLPFKEAARARVTAEQLRLAKVPREQWSFAQKFPELFLDKKARDIIQSETNRAVFQGESKTLNLFTNWAKSKGGLVDLLVATIAPYKLTPWNIIREILSYNPVIAMGRSVYEGAKGNSREAKLNAGKFVTGTLLTGVGTWLYNNGLMAPSLDERDEAQKARILSGKVLPPNHINISGLKRAMSGGDPAFKAGDETVDVFRGGGLAGSIFYMVANIGRSLERGEEVPQGQLWGSVLRQSTLEQARFGMNQSFLSGVEGLLTAVKDGNTDTFLRQWLNTVGSIPLPNSLNTISRASREYKPDFSADTFNKQVANMVRGKLGFAGLDDYLPLKRDFWGKPMRETPEGRNAIFYHFFDISKNQQVTSDPVELELYRLWRKSGDSRVIPSIPKEEIVVRNTVYPLNPKLYEKFAELVGTRRREIVDSVAVNPEFHKMTDEEKMKFLERIYLRGMDIAKGEFWSEHQDELEAKATRAGFRR